MIIDYMKCENVIPNCPCLNQGRLSQHFKNRIENHRNKDIIDTPNTQTHDRSLSWVGTGTSIKSGRVKLVYIGTLPKSNKKSQKQGHK